MGFEERAVTYSILIEGVLDEGWSNWFEQMTVRCQRRGDGSVVTRVVGTLPDQAALRGVLTQMWDLNLRVLSLRQVPDRKKGRRPNGCAGKEADDDERGGEEGT